jgi:branched-chain amino acid transport system permease protein
LMTAFFASIFGFIALRVSDLYFLLVTFALGELVYNLAIKWNAVTNGEYGLGGIPYPAFADSATSIYYLTLGVVIICSILLYFIIKSPFGYSIQGIRDNELRMKSLGYNVWLYKYIAYIIAGIFAGVAGILYVYYNGIITPYSAGVTTSGLLWLMIIIGGVGTLWGSLLGCTIMLLLEYIVSMLVPERWPLIVGGCLIIAVLFARQGIWSYITKIYARYR